METQKKAKQNWGKLDMPKSANHTSAQKADIKVVASKKKEPTRRVNVHISESLFQRLLQHEFELKKEGVAVTQTSIVNEALHKFLA